MQRKFYKGVEYMFPWVKWAAVQKGTPTEGDGNTWEGGQCKTCDPEYLAAVPGVQCAHTAQLHAPSSLNKKTITNNQD